MDEECSRKNLRLLGHHIKACVLCRAERKRGRVRVD